MSKGRFHILWTTVEKVTVAEITPFMLMHYYIVRQKTSDKQAVINCKLLYLIITKICINKISEV